MLEIAQRTPLRACLDRAPSLSFYRPREGPGVHEIERKRKRRKRKNREKESPGATSSIFSDGWVPLLV
jgi:hypothetical protein